MNSLLLNNASVIWELFKTPFGKKNQNKQCITAVLGEWASDIGNQPKGIRNL